LSTTAAASAPSAQPWRSATLKVPAAAAALQALSALACALSATAAASQPLAQRCTTKMISLLLLLLLLPCRLAALWYVLCR
jgi:hypothetical protein